MAQPLTKRMVTEASLQSGVGRVVVNDVVEEQVSEVVASDVPFAVEQALENYAPGASAGRQSVLSTVTNTTAVYPGTAVPGLSLPIVGTGRDVDLLFVFPGVEHTAANAKITFIILVDGQPLDALGTLMSVNLGAAGVAGSLGFVLPHTVTIPEGVTRTFSINTYADRAGTTSLTAISFAPIQFTARRA